MWPQVGPILLSSWAKMHPTHTHRIHQALPCARHWAQVLAKIQTPLSLGATVIPITQMRKLKLSAIPHPA